MLTRLKAVYTGLLIISIAVSAIMVCGCDDPKLVAAPHYEYTVRIGGLEQFTTESGTARIMVPVPMVSGTILMPFQGRLNGTQHQYQYGSAWDTDIVNVNNWDRHGTRYIAVVDTPDGSMIEIFFNKTGYFQFWGESSPYYSKEQNLTPDQYGVYTVHKAAPSFDNIAVRVREVLGPIGSSEADVRISSLKNRSLYPYLGSVTANHTIPAKSRSLSDYTSLVYIDENLVPITPGNHSIEINAMFEVVTGYHPYGDPGNHHRFIIRESIPGGVTGYVPVTVQYLGNVTYYDFDY